MPAIAPHKTKTTDGAWDAGENVKRLKEGQEASYYKAEFAWYDAKADDKTKGAYKFPHHLVSESGDVGSASTVACSAIIAILNGGRGGAKIPAGDRKGVHAHAAKHLRDAGKTPPELKSEDQIEKELAALAASYVPGLERRVLNFELRAEPGAEDKPAKIVGHASVFDQPTDLGWFIETVKPGAFAKTIAEDDIVALFNHNPDHVLGRNTARTLSLAEDHTGLYMEIMPPDTQLARDLTTSIKRGDIKGASIGFMVGARLIRDDDDGNMYRDLIEVKLFDVSPVTFPAFPTTDVSVRSLEALAAYEISGAARKEPAPLEAEDWKWQLDLRRRRLELVR
jgi:HK97 family phage prohead protease